MASPSTTLSVSCTLVLPTLQPLASGSGVGYTVINYNTAKQTLRCIASLAQCKPAPAWILVLDNASAQTDFDLLSQSVKPAAHSNIFLFRSDHNLGFAAGSNFLMAQLLAMPECQYLGMLNNDAVAMPEMVELLRQVLGDKGSDIGLSGGRMHKLHDPHEVDTLGISLYASLMPADRKDTQDTYLGPTGGCCLMTRSFVQDIIATTSYFFDARYFCYCEDTDLVLRANLLGYRPGYVDQLVATHEGQASSQVQSANFIAYHGLRNAIWMHWKLLPASILVRHMPWLLLAHLLTVVRQTLSGRVRVLFSIYRDAIRELPAIGRERRRLLPLMRISTAELQTRINPRFYRQGYASVVLAELLSRLRSRPT